jgi:uncharacterized protein YciI
MKHFIVEATYLAPLEEIREATARHRLFLQKGYDAGWFLCSGPQDPPVGGFLVARAPSKAHLEQLFETEPFRVEKLASYSFKEFNPVKRQPWLDDWCDKDAEARAENV